jgi:hypothetical protein
MGQCGWFPPWYGLDDDAVPAYADCLRRVQSDDCIPFRRDEGYGRDASCWFLGVGEGGFSLPGQFECYLRRVTLADRRSSSRAERGQSSSDDGLERAPCGSRCVATAEFAR